MISRLTGERARSQLAGTRFAQVEWVAETGSTNADLLARAADPGADGAVLVADFQSAGRGRRGRTWVTEPAAALMVSVLVRPVPLGLGPAELGRLTMAFGVAAAEACRQLGGDVGLKWPNDLVSRADDRKLAGILAESRSGPDGVEAVVIGMGLNANGPLPPELTATAVTLAELCGRPVDREDLLVATLRRVDELLGQVRGPEVAERYRDLSATLGRAVRVELEQGALEGRAVDVGVDGHLVVEADDGQQQLLAVGDVVHLRPVTSSPATGGASPSGGAAEPGGAAPARPGT